jgi:phosphopantetheine--protein transferase-like protein
MDSFVYVVDLQLSADGGVGGRDGRQALVKEMLESTPCLLPAERKRIHGISNVDAQLRSLAGRVLIHLAIRLHASPDSRGSAVLTRGVFRKPMLVPKKKSSLIDAEQPPLLEFNVSHDKDLVVVACNTGGHAIGVDVVHVRTHASHEVDEYLRLMENTASATEWAGFLGKHKQHKLELEHAHLQLQRLFRFYVLFSMKESVSKALGKGLYLAFNEIEIDWTASDTRIIDQMFLDTPLATTTAATTTTRGAEAEDKACGAWITLHPKVRVAQRDISVQCRIRLLKKGAYIMTHIQIH